jgi:hypothetical protein
MTCFVASNGGPASCLPVPSSSTTISFAFAADLRTGLALIACLPLGVVFVAESLCLGVTPSMLRSDRKSNDIGEPTVTLSSKHINTFAIPATFGLGIHPSASSFDTHLGRRSSLQYNSSPVAALIMWTKGDYRVVPTTYMIKSGQLPGQSFESGQGKL